MQMKLMLGDSLRKIEELPNSMFDLALCDLPYGTTQCAWDSIIPLKPMWEQLHRVCKVEAAMVFTSAQPFTTTLIASNIKNFKYCWVWEKSKATNYLNSKKQPLRAHEDVVVFYRKLGVYNPQMTNGLPYNKGTALRTTESYGKQRSIEVKSDSGNRYPRSVIYFKTAESEGKVVHPTQKPLALMEYLIRTYSNEGHVVLDLCMGSGTTGVACKRLNRAFVGIEIDAEYFEIAQQRIEEW